MALDVNVTDLTANTVPSGMTWLPPTLPICGGIQAPPDVCPAPNDAMRHVVARAGTFWAQASTAGNATPPASNSPTSSRLAGASCGARIGR
ncbi:hypothetical protein WJ968_11445 [Achromobacter xylosoxidans]